MRALVVGVGGLGCPAASTLAAAGVALTLCDFDRVEERNLGRQDLYTADDIGRLKVEAARDRLDGDVAIEPRPFDAGMVGGHGVVLDCTDEPGGRAFVHQACLDARVPLVWAAVSERTGQLATVVPGEGPCLRCLWRGVGEPAPCDADTDADVLRRTGTLQAESALDVLDGHPDTGRLVLVDGASLRTLRFDRRDGCPACGTL